MKYQPSVCQHRTYAMQNGNLDVQKGTLILYTRKNGKSTGVFCR